MGERKRVFSIILVILILWFIGVVTSNSFGGELHLLPLVALVVFAIWFVGRKRIA
jgi:hypothetical protein